MIYWDTSVILKLYVEEEHSSFWQAVAFAQRPPLCTSALTEVEFVFALRQKEQRGELLPGSTTALRDMFGKDVACGHFLTVPIGSDILEVCRQLPFRKAFEKGQNNLRTLDGVHLATALKMDCRSIATADKRLAIASRLAGLKLEK